MAEKVAGVYIDIDARFANLESSLAKAQRELAGFQSGTKRAANDVENSMNRVSRSMQRTGVDTRMLGYQLNDVGTQLASGTSPFLILAQQGPQMAMAMERAKGALGTFAGFMTGPWGAAMTIGLTLAGPYIAKMFGIGDAADKAKPKVVGLAAAIERLNNAQSKPQQQDLIDLQGSVDLSKRIADGMRDRIARAEAYKVPQSTSINRAFEVKSRARSLAKLKSDLAALESTISEQEGLVNATRIRVENYNRMDQSRDAFREAQRDAKAAASAAAKDAKAAAADAARITDAYTATLGAMQQQAQLEQMRRNGQEYAAAMLEARWTIERQFPGLDRARLDTLIDQNQALARQKVYAEDIASIMARAPTMESAFQDFNDRMSASAQPTLIKAMKDMGILMPEIERDLGKRTKTIAQSWEDMSHRIIGSMNDVVSGLRGGGFLQTLQGALDIFMQLAGLGVFGSSVQTTVNTGVKGARASGGPVTGGASYLVGERGPELFTPGASGFITPNNRLMAANDHVTSAGGGMAIRIEPSPYFDAVVDQRAGNVAAPMAVRAGVAGADMAQRNIGRQRRNRIP